MSVSGLATLWSAVIRPSASTSRVTVATTRSGPRKTTPNPLLISTSSALVSAGSTFWQPTPPMTANQEATVVAPATGRRA